MKILQVVPFFSPVHGGSAIVPYYISRELARRGHEVTIFSGDYKLSREWVGSLHEVKVCSFKTWLGWAKFYVTPSIINHANERIKYFDLIHMHNYRSFQNIVVHYYAMKYGVPYVLQAHGSLPRIGSWRKLKWIYDALFGYKFLRDASKVIALSRVEAEQYRSMGIPEEKIAIIPNGIDLSEYDDLPPKGSFRKKFNIPDDKKIILYLGRIHKTKGIDFLIRAYAHLRNEMKFKDAILVMAGPDDGYLRKAKSLAVMLGVYDSVLFTGFISSNDKLRALVDADVFVTPSFHGFPMTFLEACAVGTPIVTTSLGDTLEWIDNKVGYVTQPTPHDLTEAIYKIISDGNLRRTFSRNCSEVVQSNFSIEKVVERLENVYKEILEGK
jgi:glycosyltransferase involved in cell wall biosynthesis